MIKPVAIIAGEPNSISSEIIFKAWKLRKKYIHKPFFVIGNIRLLNSQNKKLRYNLKIKKINPNFKLSELNGNKLPVYDVKYNQKKPFEKISKKSNKYIFKCFDLALKFFENKKIIGFINCPIAKESLFENRYQGVTEFLSKKAGIKNHEVMLLYNRNLSVSPITTHIPLKKVSKKININKIVNNVKIINNFYRKIFKIKPSFGVLGLNPHNYAPSIKSEEKLIIKKAVNKLKKSRIQVSGPIVPDSSFMIRNRNDFNVIIGMYHDQVLSPFKTLYNFNAINITLGLPYIRISPDHGIGENITGKKKANPTSLIESIKFFNYIK